MIALSPAVALDDTLLERFDAALDTERAALLSGDEERLSGAEREKSSLIDAFLNLNRAGPPRELAKRLRDSAKRLRDSAKRLRDLADKNRLNGLLIAERLCEIQRRRQFFEHSAGRGSVYGPDGVTHPA